MQTHVVPVGFDYDRLIAPLVRDQLQVDHVVLLEGAVGSEANVEYSRELTDRLEQDFASLLGASTERVRVDDVYDYDAAFAQAFALVESVLDGEPDAEVWVNVSAMPRPVSFAFATAAHSLAVERPADRDRIHTYYTAPEKYLETDLAETLRETVETLADCRAALAAGDRDGDAADQSTPDLDHVDDRLAAARDLLAEFDERGTTVGAKAIDGRHVLELPVASFSNVKPFEAVVLFTLGEHGPFDSVSDLAETLADELDESYTDSFRSKVIYHVDGLGPGGKGYVEREERGKSYRTSLSRIGALWVRAHADDAEDALRAVEGDA